MRLQVVEGPLCGLAQEVLHLGEDLLDRVEVRAVGRKEKEPCPSRSDRGTDSVVLVAAEVVEDDDVARLQRWNQNLIDIGPEALAVDWTIENPWGLDTITPQGGEEGHCLPVTVRDLCREPAAPRAPTSDWSHVGLGPGLVDEDESPWIKKSLIFLPACPLAGDVRPILLAWQHAFF